jgi:hypothetical protein
LPAIRQHRCSVTNGSHPGRILIEIDRATATIASSDNHEVGGWTRPRASRFIWSRMIQEPFDDRRFFLRDPSVHATYEIGPNEQSAELANSVGLQRSQSIPVAEPLS